MENKPLYLLCISILPLMVCSGMVYSIMAIYINSLGASVTHIGLIYMTGAATGAFFSPMIGKLSDRVGRRLIMVFSMVGFTAAFSSYSLIGNYVQAFPIQALEGVTWAAMGTTTTAFIADIVPTERRGWAIGMYERTWFVGWIIGPLLGGLLADTIGFRTTFLIGASLIVFGLLLMLLFVEERKPTPVPR